MKDLDSWVKLACEQGASDLHLEPGLPASLRIRGDLRSQGERMEGAELSALARSILGEVRWGEFVEHGSADLSRSIGGVRCRVHVLKSARGVGLAIRLLAAPVATLARLNLHPSLKRLMEPTHGLVLICGPTGSGKTSTMAALLQEVNLEASRHIVTLESPIEYSLTPKRSFIRQREVGRDTPSFERGLYDALREDPDVLMVGEMRDPEVMRLTLTAAETGHLVLATVHSGSVAEALQRIVAAFPAESQAGVCAQLGDCLVGGLAQRLVYRQELGFRVPECEVLLPGTAARALIRQGQFFKLPTVLESGAADGSWSLMRYRSWLDGRQDWVRPTERLPEEQSATGSEDAVAINRPAVAIATSKRPRMTNESASEVLELDSEPEDLTSLLHTLETRPAKATRR